MKWSNDAHSFSQRHGYEPLPEVMRLEELPEKARIGAYNIIFDIVSVCGDWSYHTNKPVPRMCRSAISACLAQAGDTIPDFYQDIASQLRHIILKEPFNRVFDLLEYVASHRDDRNTDEGRKLNGRLERFPSQINDVFDRHRAAYVFDTSQPPYRIWPRTSEAQGKAVQNAVAMLKECQLPAAVTHLRQAADHLDLGNHADAIVDCIHAVESVARFFDPKASETLGPAIDSLQRQGVLKHPALAKVIRVLYGFTSNEEGVRHALVFNDEADVDINEAMLMFGACASLAAYLANVCRQLPASEVS